MSIDLIFFNEYAVFVWPAFMFTFLSFLILYIKTRKELNKQESIYLKEYKQVSTVNIRPVKQKEIIEQVLSGNSI
jgi:heme exporter protein D